MPPLLFTGSPLGPCLIRCCPLVTAASLSCMPMYAAARCCCMRLLSALAVRLPCRSMPMDIASAEMQPRPQPPSSASPSLLLYFCRAADASTTPACACHHGRRECRATASLPHQRAFFTVKFLHLLVCIASTACRHEHARAKECNQRQAPQPRVHYWCVIRRLLSSGLTCQASDLYTLKAAAFNQAP